MQDFLHYKNQLKMAQARTGIVPMWMLPNSLSPVILQLEIMYILAGIDLVACDFVLFKMVNNTLDSDSLSLMVIKRPEFRSTGREEDEGAG